MNLLRRSLAPLSDDAWAAIDDEARGVLEANLAARRFVDVLGPHGWGCSAVSLGRLGELRQDGEVRWGTRRILPLVELRVPFMVGRWELDDLARGARAVDLGPVRAAAASAARFEERAIYAGLPDAGIQGILQTRPLHPPLAWPTDVYAIPDRVVMAQIRLTNTGIEGPTMLVLGDAEYRAVAGEVGGYPVRQQLEALVGRAPVYSPGLEGGMLVSTRGGDFELTLGVDLSIGFDRVERDHVHLFITETFAFRILDPEAVVVLERQDDEPS
ncbi:family 1 encapsulin nanocompartment shell protein [Paraliomyxa miuraensis]|uniref:family 1 encapsulin nanocompartment shell protein n=1 Tax=Paraliomyxa miuraensis TaxID=376150 RepID=UPI002257EB7F|nr:family 1 encapsulin nanocompartment shell protein [Paraliomyxa miuraensis]MCX4247145.1 family 1 encapsulin nanocompartment shell protein [Paraliomyxa miuraensis]